MSPTIAQGPRNNRAPAEMCQESLFQTLLLLLLLLLLFLLVAPDVNGRNRLQSTRQGEFQSQTIRICRSARTQSANKSSPMHFHTCPILSAETPTMSINLWCLLALLVASLLAQIIKRTHDVKGALSDRGSSYSLTLKKETFRTGVANQMYRH